MSEFNLQTILDDPTRGCAQILGTVMLFPDKSDPDCFEMQKRFLRRALVDHEIQLMKQGRLTATQVVKLVAKAAEVMPIEWINERVSEPLHRGTIAGTVFYNAICNRDFDVSEGAIGKTVERLDRRLRKNGERISKSLMNNTILPRFRPVGHLWAAYVGEYKNGRTAFPCPWQDVKAFMACAEAYRRAGEVLKMPHSDTTLFDADKMYKLNGLQLPEIELKFAPVN